MSEKAGPISATQRLAKSAQLLASGLETVVDLVHEQVAALPEYAVVASDTDGRRYMRDASHFLLQSFLERLKGRNRESSLVEFVRDASLRRAEEGVPVQAVLYSYQVASRVVWEWITNHDDASADGRDLSEFWTLWMTHVERATRAVLDAYVTAASTEAISTSTIRWQFLSDFTGGMITDETLDHRLNEIGYGKSKTFIMILVAAWSSESTSPARMARLGAKLVQNLTFTNRGTPPCVTIQGSRAIILLGMPKVSIDGIRKAVMEIVEGEGDQLGVVISRENQWSIPGKQVFDHLDAVARTVLPKEIVYVDELTLIDHAASRLYPDISQIISTQMLAFVRKGYRDQPEWLETVNALVAHNLNVRDAAKSMVVHPNTIYYRIDQIRQQFDLDPMQIKSLMDMYIVIRLIGALRQSGLT